MFLQNFSKTAIREKGRCMDLDYKVSLWSFSADVYKVSKFAF